MNCIRLLRFAEKQSISVFKISSARYVSQHPLRFLETQDMWREKDNVSKRWQLIYKAPMETALKFASAYLTITTGIVGGGSLYYAGFVYNPANINDPIVIGDDVVIANSPIEGFVYLGGFLALHIAIKLLLSKYVVRLYQDGDEYLAVYRGNLFNNITIHEFQLKEFQKLNPLLPIIPWHDSRFRLGKKQGIILENYFKTPEYFNYLLTKNNKDKAEEDD